jgi:hypothetical protein
VNKNFTFGINYDRLDRINKLVLTRIENNSDVEEPEGQMYFHCRVDMQNALSLMDDQEVDRYVALGMDNLYRALFAKILKLIEGRKEYLTFKADLVVKPVSNDFKYGGMLIDLVLYYELFVTPSRATAVYIPEIRYDAVPQSWSPGCEMKRTPIEWRCGHCTTPNPMERRTCTQCGAPRALLIQEMDNE